MKENKKYWYVPHGPRWREHVILCINNKPKEIIFFNRFGGWCGDKMTKYSFDKDHHKFVKTGKWLNETELFVKLL